MKTLFERVFNGSDQMFAKAEEEVNKIVAEVGRDAPLTMPSTAYCLACIYAYIGKKVTTVGELQDTLADVKAMMLREPRTNSIFQSGVGTAIAAEMIEACKYVKTDAPYEGTNYHGHFVDAEVRELGVPLVTGDIPGFVVIEPGARSVQTYERIKSLAKDIGITKVRVVANKIRDDSDREFIRSRIPADDLLGFISYNPDVIDADRKGLSPYDCSPQALEEIRAIKARIDQE